MTSLEWIFMTLSIPVPNLTTAHSGPLFPVEEVILNHVTTIEVFMSHEEK